MPAPWATDTAGDRDPHAPMTHMRPVPTTGLNAIEHEITPYTQRTRPYSELGYPARSRVVAVIVPVMDFD